MHARLSIVLVLVAACHHGAASKAPSNTAGGQAASSGMPYDGLFQPGASWQFTVTSEESHWDDQDPTADASGNVHTSEQTAASCHVTDTRGFPGGRAAAIECEDSSGSRLGDTVGGVWIQTADGLWHGQDLPDEGAAPKLAAADRFLAARPEAGQTKHEEPESDQGPASGETVDISALGSDGWCISRGSWGGDESWDSLCLDARGPQSGSAGWAGGSTHESKFERVDGK